MKQNLQKFSLPEHFRGKPQWFVQLWWIVQAIFFNTTPQFMYAWRRFLLRMFGAKVGKKVIIRPSVKTTYPWKVEIGDYSWIGDNVNLYSLGRIKIGNNVVISQKCYLCTGSHDYEKESFDIFEKTIVIEDEAWVAADVFVGPGVTIGTAAVIGARSSVFKSLQPNCVYAGHPLRLVRKR